MKTRENTVLQRESPTGLVPAAASCRRPLSEELRLLALRFDTQPACLREVVEQLQGRGYALVLILLCLPFLTPIPVPMVSTLFGAAIALIGLRQALGQRPRLPRRMLQMQIPAKWFPRLLKASSRIVRALEWILKPRWQWLHNRVVFRRVRAVLILLCGLKLLLPLPVPMSNFFPAATALLLAASELEEDGLIYCVGLLAFVVSTAFFALLAFGGAASLRALFA